MDLKSSKVSNLYRNVRPKIVVFHSFRLLPYLILRQNKINFWRLYIGQMLAVEAMQVTPGGPNTHNNTH